jgi:hypothetical protein
MSPGLELIEIQSASPSWVKPLQEAIAEDERLNDRRFPDNLQTYSSRRSRSQTILSYISDQYACSDQADEPTNAVEITVSELMATEQFTVSRKTVREDLDRLVAYGYFETETAGNCHTYWVADPWVNGDRDESATLRLADVSERPDAENRVSTIQETPTPSVEASRNYHQAVTLFKQGATNLTTRQRVVASIFGSSSPLVGILGVILIVSGQDPNLVAAGESSLWASVTLLIGWLWLQFVGLVEGVPDDQQDVVFSSESTHQ